MNIFDILKDNYVLVDQRERREINKIWLERLVKEKGRKLTRG